MRKAGRSGLLRGRVDWPPLSGAGVTERMLNYGDAVAHLHIARRVFDSRTPRFSQLGSVWLPLPHILLIPFVQVYELVGQRPRRHHSLGPRLHRLLRGHLSAGAPLAQSRARPRSRSPSSRLNPNLLYLQTTAMTEPLFVCEVIWIVVWMAEWRAALDEEIAGASYDLRSDPSAHPRSHLRLVRFARLPLRIFEASGPRRGAWLGNPLAAPAPRKNIPINETQSLQVCIAIALIAAIFTRYDGWIIALLAWTGVGFTLLRHAAAGERGRLSSSAFWLASAGRRRRAAPLVSLQLRQLRRLALLCARAIFRQGNRTPHRSHRTRLAAASRLAQSLGCVPLLRQSLRARFRCCAGLEQPLGKYCRRRRRARNRHGDLHRAGPCPQTREGVDAAPLAASPLLHVVCRLRVGAHLLPSVVAVHLVQHALRPGTVARARTRSRLRSAARGGCPGTHTVSAA